MLINLSDNRCLIKTPKLRIYPTENHFAFFVIPKNVGNHWMNKVHRFGDFGNLDLKSYKQHCYKKEISFFKKLIR